MSQTTESTITGTDSPAKPPLSSSSKIVDIFQQSFDEEHEPTGSEHLTFSLGDELYTVNILCVKEIRAWEEVTRIPNTPEHIKGVINLRGNIIPVVDLRQYFNLKNITYISTTVVIVIAIEVETTSEAESIIREIKAGIVVDMVSDVIRFSENDINESPQFREDKKSEFIKGLITASISENIINEESSNDLSNKNKIQEKNEPKKTGVNMKERMVMLLDTKSIGKLIIENNSEKLEPDKSTLN